jgi:hypothetical protein
VVEKTHDVAGVRADRVRRTPLLVPHIPLEPVDGRRERHR